jgi:hypothetical protein
MKFYIRNDANNRYYFLIKIDCSIKELVSSSYECIEDIHQALLEIRNAKKIIRQHFGYYYVTVMDVKNRIICTSDHFDTYESCVVYINLLRELLEDEGQELVKICENLLK